MKYRARKFFLLGEQYFKTAELLLETLINGGNSNAGVGNSYEEAYEIMEKNVAKSDATLFIPAIFMCLQSTELFVKGLMLLNEIEIDGTHEIQKFLEILKELYTESSLLYKEIKKMYYSHQEILKKYKKDNGITNSHDLYMSLRYPEKNNTSHDSISYYALIYNNDEGIELFRAIKQNLTNIRNSILLEYNRLF
ncbi:MAG: HEPN domain-containing protein [Ruminococcaceae bacterium]|nr:HEPN domain-containing protein [Oscillospiraceae bacterium]